MGVSLHREEILAVLVAVNESPVEQSDNLKRAVKKLNKKLHNFDKMEKNQALRRMKR